MNLAIATTPATPNEVIDSVHETITPASNLYDVETVDNSGQHPSDLETEMKATEVKECHHPDVMNNSANNSIPMVTSNICRSVIPRKGLNVTSYKVA